MVEILGPDPVTGPRQGSGDRLVEPNGRIRPIQESLPIYGLSRPIQYRGVAIVESATWS